MAIRAWNYMGGEMNWQALPFVVEKFGVSDVERLVDQLVVIRDRKE